MIVARELKIERMNPNWMIKRANDPIEQDAHELNGW